MRGTMGDAIIVANLATASPCQNSRRCANVKTTCRNTMIFPISKYQSTRKLLSVLVLLLIKIMSANTICFLKCNFFQHYDEQKGEFTKTKICLGKGIAPHEVEVKPKGKFYDAEVLR